MKVSPVPNQVLATQPSAIFWLSAFMLIMSSVITGETKEMYASPEAVAALAETEMPVTPTKLSTRAPKKPTAFFQLRFMIFLFLLDFIFCQPQGINP
ncbi:unannotated protein [freshwater metagenome]|uniref:Unannotated protein n=1 Tax=freshwater metagenome TaxID=449393 RepID=A0A6J6NY89_9ZZZZ